MKLFTILTLSTLVSVSAFSVNNNRIPTSSTKKQATVPDNVKRNIATAATTFLATLTIASSATFASTTDQFTLPSYNDATKNKITAVDKVTYKSAWDEELEKVNQKILDQASASRDDKSVNKENNERFIQLKAEEAEEEQRMIRMRKMAEQERIERIAQEKAETKANRWNTF